MHTIQLFNEQFTCILPFLLLFFFFSTGNRSDNTYSTIWEQTQWINYENYWWIDNFASSASISFTSPGVAARWNGRKIWFNYYLWRLFLFFYQSKTSIFRASYNSFIASQKQNFYTFKLCIRKLLHSI